MIVTHDMLPVKGNYVYILKLGEEIVYVGQTKNYIKRMYDHYKYMQDFDSYSLIHVENKNDLNSVEFVTIAEYRPVANKVYPSVDFLICESRLKRLKLKQPKKYKDFDINNPDYCLPLTFGGTNFWVSGESIEWVKIIDSYTVIVYV